jgi:hypothetical protein
MLRFPNIADILAATMEGEESVIMQVHRGFKEG